MAGTQAGSYGILLSSILFLIYRYWYHQSKIRHPPSPKSLPFIGCLLSIPSESGHIAFSKLGEQLRSDIIFLRIFGQKIIVLNSAEAASDLLEKRSAIYSDRALPTMVTHPTLMNWSRNVSAVGYNDLWRHYRRMMNNWLNARTVTQFRSLQERHTRLLLNRLLTSTKLFQPFDHVRDEFFYATASLMFELAYGYKLQSPQDLFCTEATLAYHNLACASMHTNFLVNTFPAMTCIPDWFPGTGWKRTARAWRTQQEEAKTAPYDWLKAQVAAGKNQPSLLGALLQDHRLLSGLSLVDRDERLKEIGSILFGGGTDTSSNLYICFIAAMALNPHIQAKAQKELDAVLGRVTLPCVSDMDRLPYIKNLIEELWRLYPVFPLAIPHTCFQEDNYRGYDIEKGTTIIGNIWMMGRDPRHYKDPEVFNPDRYLDYNVPRPPAFGWGRRKCPGIHFAETSAFVTIASLLATFTFSKKRNKDGQEVMPKIEVERNSLVLELKPFEFEFKPRSDEHFQLIIGANIDLE